MPIAAPDAITSLSVAEQTLGRSRWEEAEDFFTEWRDPLPSLSEGDRAPGLWVGDAYI
jgi:hypothetical protein